MELRPYQKEAKDAIFREWAAGHRKTLTVMPTGCHAAGERVMRADGTAVRVEDVRIGDHLMGADSRPREVLRLVRGTGRLYTIIPVKGKPFTVNEDHLLTLVRTRERTIPRRQSEKRAGEIIDVSVREWLGWSENQKHLYKLIRSQRVEFPDRKPEELLIDPHFLGVLLGDGGLVNSINVTTPDAEIVRELEEEAARYGMYLTSSPAGKARTYFFKGGAVGKNGGRLHGELKALGLRRVGSGDKHVPERYKNALADVRLRVIAGLIDTDGYATCGGYDFISKSRRLADDLAFMCRSVGLAAYVKESIKSCGDFTGTYWRVSVSGDCGIIPCRVARKRLPARRQKKNVLHTGFSVIPAGEGSYYGFTVDGDNRYLLDDFTITHNCGKTILFGGVTEDCVKMGERVLILAHRAELLTQAADKIGKLTGLGCAVEKAEETCLGSWWRVVVGSVQTLGREKRLANFAPDYFDTIIIDEAHHAISDTYRAVIDHFSGAKLLGVTATPDRGDMKNLGEIFDSLAYEYTLPKAIREGYLSPIKAQTIPLKLDLSGVGVQAGDYKPGELANALEPYLHQIASEMKSYCKDRKTVVFLPLVKISQEFRDILVNSGFRAAEVNGNSPDREEILRDFDEGKYDVLCNSMLLTEGWDCPSVDCVVVLRPTKVRGLYCLDEQTEILTKDGWKRDVEVGEEVLAFDRETGETRFVPALAKVRRPLEPDECFCSLRGQSTDIRVTDKHRMLYDNKRRQGWKIKTAEELAKLRDGCYIPVSGHGGFNGVPLTDDELRFIGWVMTDGTINRINNAITITQASHQPWIEEIQRCVEACGFKYRRFVRNADTDYHRNSDCVCWTISKGKPRGTGKDRRGWGALEPWLSKDMSPLLDDMTERQFDVMLEAINLADGHKQKADGWTQRSYHIRKGNCAFIEALQRMGIQRGYRASVSEQTDVRHNPIWCVHLKKQDFVFVGGRYDRRPQWTRESGEGESCWCVQNELGTLVTRRNGKVAIVGNCQMVGRGTRLSPGKKDLLILDFLWHTERHELCRPANLICENPKVAKKMTENLEKSGVMVDLEEAEKQASEDVVAQREEALARELAEMRTRKRKLVDPLQFELSIQAEDLSGYVPSFGWEAAPATEKQLALLEKYGIFTDGIENAGKASKLLERLSKRHAEGLTTPKQIRFLESRGFLHVGTWAFEDAKKMIDRIAANDWRVPYGINPGEYVPQRGA